MSLLNRLTPWQVQPPQETKSRIQVRPSSRHPSRTFMEGRTVRCNVGDRIFGEGTNQQIRVLNLNRRPNINSRPVSLTATAAAAAAAATPVSALVCLPRVHGFLGLAHSFVIGFAIQPVPYLRHA